MDYQRAKDELKQRLTDYVESVTKKSRASGKYVCPICKSGTRNKQTGAFSIDSKDPTRWKCFSCGNGGDIFDLIGLVENIPEPVNQLRRAAELYGITLDNDSNIGSKYTHMSIHTSTNTQAKPEKKDSLLPYFRECQKHLAETDYLTKRGISEEVAKRFMLGYDTKFKTRSATGELVTWKALIIPTGEYSCIARNTDEKADKDDRYRKRGQSDYINKKRLQTAEKPIYITEGELDALSIIEVGGEAVGLGSAEEKDKFVSNVLKKQKPAQPLILALDNDEAGKRATEELAEKLDELEIPYYRIDPYNGHKDANEALTADREAFKEEIARAEHIEEERLEEERDAYLQTSVSYHLEHFLENIASSENTMAQPTGYRKLDSILDGGLYAGLYIIGAITSLGKTTLALQMADQIAKRGRDVLIFSLEMARSELMSKSISRGTFLKAVEDNLDVRQYAKTNRGITTWARWENYSVKEQQIIVQAMEEYYKYANHVYIHEGMGDIGTEKIKEEIRKHQCYTGQTPVIVVDYLQILAPHDVRATDKQNTDKAVLELKRISRDYHTPVIGISSLNRAGYNDPITYEAFKESGAIEYGSDVLIGLQLKGVGTPTFDVNEAKRKEPREVELVILKNRNGKTGDTIEYRYYPMFNYFEEKP